MTSVSPPEIETQLHQSADALERAALRCVTEVGVEDYCGLLLQRLSGLQKHWTSSRSLHQELCEEISEVDPALTPAADRMTGAHASITAEIVDLVSATLQVLSSQAGPNQLVESQRLRARVMSCVARCRSYDRRLSDWLLEAHFRDRGRGAS